MNDRISELMEDAADDDGRPLPFTPAMITVRGRSARRRRAATVVGGLAASVIVVTGGVALAIGGHTGSGAAPVGRPTATDSVSASGTPTGPTTAATVSAPPLDGGRDTTRCDAAGTKGSPHLMADGWYESTAVSDDVGTTATFISPDGSAWASCTLWAPGAPVQDDVLTAATPLDTTPVPHPWPSPDSGIASYSLCGKDGPATCVDTLYEGTFPLREGVASVDVETPVGNQVVVALGLKTYVVRFVADAGATSTPPIIATLRDASGAVLARYDYNKLLR